jgi:Uncharacterised protein family (UPF0257).
MVLRTKIPLLSLFVVSACAFGNGAYIPVLYNFSLLKAFNPVEGKVKDFNVVMTNEKGDKIYTLSAELSDDGCLESLQSHDKRKNSELILKRDGRSLKGIKDWSIIVFSLDEKCNIASKMEHGSIEEYITSPEGALTSVRFMGNKTSEFFYDEYGRISVTKMYSSRGETASKTISYSDEEHKPMDYTLIKTSLYSDDYTAKNICQYDSRGTPFECDLTITFGDKPDSKVLKRKVYTKASFY